MATLKEIYIFHNKVAFHVEKKIKKIRNFFTERLNLQTDNFLDCINEILDFFRDRKIYLIH